MLVVKNKRLPYGCNDERWNNQYAFHPLLMNELNRFLGSDEHAEIPKVNIAEDDKSYTIELAAPGVAKEDLKINIEKEVLTISSEIKKTTEEKQPKFIKKEFSFYGFKRSFKMPENTDSAAIKASYANGILRVVFPKKDATTESAPKTISIS